jgi:23S rRNA (adenine2503-C2)-methyltransferase
MDEAATEHPRLLYDLDKTDLTDLVQSMGQPKFRADQIWQGVYINLWSEIENFISLPMAMRNLLEETISLASLSVARELKSSDHQTRKILFSLPDGQQIESVWMGYHDRNTLCISTQAGCAMNCSFCATGQMGFKRNLTSGEIVEQVLYFARELHQHDQHVTNIVFMGMGEPFHNYENVMAAIDRLNDEKGFNFGARRMTISTVGIVPQIKRFADEKRQVNLAISLHSPADDLRSSMMPVNKKYCIGDLLEACHYYVQVTHRRITFEYALIHDVNDSPETAEALSRRLKGLLCHVNLIPLNPTKNFQGQAATTDRVQQFKAVLDRYNIPCTVRLRRGIDIKAGCGQLASNS